MQPPKKFRSYPLNWDKWWMGWAFSLVLLVIWLAVSVWFLRGDHSPGIAIGLLALAGGLVSLRPEMKPLEKFCWMVIMGMLLSSEIRSIHRDRKEADSAAARDRANQTTNFEGILKKQNADFLATVKALKQNYDQNQEQFQVTVDKLDGGLRAEQKTLEQTRPKAFVQTQAMTTVMAGFNPFPHYVIVEYANKGQDMARQIFVFGMPFIASADRNVAKSKVESEFFDAWKKATTGATPSQLMAPNDPFHKQLGPFFPEMEDRKALKDVPMTYRVYTVVRIQFTDSSGTWFTDDCQEKNSAGDQINCGFLGESRYPAGASAAKFALK